jgi:outer membrane protein assembly factor BamB
LFIGSCSGEFHALDARTGRTRWKYDIRADGPQRSFHGAMLLWRDLVVVSADNTFRQAGIGHVYAFERATGKVRWKHRSAGGIPSDIVRDGNRAYVVSLSDELICLDLNDGRELWRFAGEAVNKPDADGRYRTPHSPVVAVNRVFFAGLDAKVRALDTRTGEPVWKHTMPADISAGPAAVSGGLTVGTTEPALYALEPKRGEVLRRLELPEPARGVLVFDKRRLFARLGRSTLAAIDADLKGVAWQQDTPGRWTASRPIVAGDVVVTGDSRGELVAFRCRDGAAAWRVTFAGENIRSVSMAGGTYFVGTLDGTVYAWQPTSRTATTSRPSHG